ncbi:MAG: hypothetical protein UHX00_00150 [Caryophanon sp.]|nr:hypothetical protein [Caryophanon sp.]
MKKMRASEDYLYHLYMHMDEIGKFVIFSELSISQFITSIEQHHHLLLLKCPFEGSAYNAHTYFDYVPKTELLKFKKQVAERKEDICFVDFQFERSLDLLTPKEQSELLYLAHKREPIISPFFYKLNNRFVVYSSPSERLTKVFFRQLDDAEKVVASVLNEQIAEREGTNGFWRRKLKTALPMVQANDLKLHRASATEGVLLSLVKQGPKSYALEFRVLGDRYDYPDEIWFELRELLKEQADVMIPIDS